MNSPLRAASVQAPKAVVMIRPHHFTPNPQTAADNAFQSVDAARSAAAVAKAAHHEATEAARLLEAAGVTVRRFEDETTRTPDSCFPNNWFSTHSGGHVAIYPMYSPNRRQERRVDPAHRRDLGRTGQASGAPPVTILPLPIPTIELAGGSVRCMLAGIHLAPRPQPRA